MANHEHLDLLKQGENAWNEWREQHLEVRPDLRGADLSGANLSGAHLRRADLIEAHLSRADLRRADLGGADLSRAYLSYAYLSEANLSGAHLRRADLWSADLSRAYLSGADFSGADLSFAYLSGADFSFAYLIEANLTSANLSGADLSGAHLRRADLRRADLSFAYLSGADFSFAYLIEANLSGANLVGTNFTHANLSDCQIYGISAWDVHLEEATQLNLVITPQGQPTITVDNLKVAQFIYLLLNNQEIREVITTIAQKVVLILGRFTPQQKGVLDALRQTLRTHNYLPVVVDFEKPGNQDLTETVSILAHLSRFVIADLTDPSSVPHELATILPQCIVPVQPILLQGKQEYALLADLRRRYDWLLPTLRYQDTDSLLASLKEQIIEPAEQKAQELEKR